MLSLDQIFLHPSFTNGGSHVFFFFFNFYQVRFYFFAITAIRVLNEFLKVHHLSFYVPGPLDFSPPSLFFFPSVMLCHDENLRVPFTPPFLFPPRLVYIAGLDGAMIFPQRYVSVFLFLFTNECSFSSSFLARRRYSLPMNANIKSSSPVWALLSLGVNFLHFFLSRVSNPTDDLPLPKALESLRAFFGSFSSVDFPVLMAGLSAPSTQPSHPYATPLLPRVGYSFCFCFCGFYVFRLFAAPFTRPRRPPPFKPPPCQAMAVGFASCCFDTGLQRWLRSRRALQKKDPSTPPLMSSLPLSREPPLSLHGNSYTPDSLIKVHLRLFQHSNPN